MIHDIRFVKRMVAISDVLGIGGAPKSIFSGGGEQLASVFQIHNARNGLM